MALPFQEETYQTPLSLIFLFVVTCHHYKSAAKTSLHERLNGVNVVKADRTVVSPLSLGGEILGRTR